MPRVPDASSVTRFRAIQSSVVADPVKKSASYIPSQPGLLTPLRASTQGQGLFPGGTVLATPIVSPYIHSRHRGYVTGPPPPPLLRIEIDGGGVDFSENPTVSYEFTEFGGIPPATSFEVVLINVLNPSSIGAFNITDIVSGGRLSGTSLSISPAWPGSALSVDAGGNFVKLETSTSTPAFPTNGVLTFTGVPLVDNLVIFVGSVNA